MILNAYTIFDNKALLFNAPFFQHNDAVARRMFGELATDTNTQIGRHPSDFQLYCIGTYDDTKGELVPISPRRHIVDAIALLPMQDAQPELFAGNPVPRSLNPVIAS